MGGGGRAGVKENSDRGNTGGSSDGGRGILKVLHHNILSHFFGSLSYG